MIRKIIIAATFLLYYGYVESGTNPLTIQRGRDSNITTNSFMAYVHNMRFTHYFGGSIISTRLVVTAGNRLFGIDPRSFIVHVGSLSPSEGGKSYAIENTVIPNAYNASPNENDIGLLVLKHGSEFGTDFGAINLPPRDFTFTVGLRVEALGFGDMENGSRAQKLQEANFTIIENDRCGASTSQFCIENEGENKDIKLRTGDAGDPIIYHRKLIGIVCSIDFRLGVSVIVRVPEKLDFIHGIVEIYP